MDDSVKAILQEIITREAVSNQHFGWQDLVAYQLTLNNATFWPDEYTPKDAIDHSYYYEYAYGGGVLGMGVLDLADFR